MIIKYIIQLTVNINNLSGTYLNITDSNQRSPVSLSHGPSQNLKPKEQPVSDYLVRKGRNDNIDEGDKGNKQHDDVVNEALSLLGGFLLGEESHHEEE